MLQAPWALGVASAVVVVVLTDSPTAAAQEAAPVVPRTEDCPVEPCSLPLLQGTTPVVAIAAAPTAPLTPTPWTLPDGAAEGEGVADSTATVREAKASRDAGDNARLRPVYRSGTAGGPETIDPLVRTALELGPERVRGADLVGLVSLSDAHLLPDGRPAAIVETANGQRSFWDFIFFARVDGRWLTDQTVPLDG